MRYEDPPLLTHAEADEVLGAALRAEAAPYEAHAAIVGLALYDDDRQYVESWCLRLAQSAADVRLKGTAALGIGHLARRFRIVGSEAENVVRQQAADADMVALDGRAAEALEDIEQFVDRS